MLRKDAQRLEVRGGPDDEAVVGAASGDEFACVGGGDSENGGCVVLVGSVAGAVLVAFCGDELRGATTYRAWGLFRWFLGI